MMELQASGTMWFQEFHGLPTGNPATAHDPDLARRFALSAGEPDSERLPNPLSKHVTGAFVVAFEPADYDGGTDLRFYEGLPEPEQAIPGLSALRAGAVQLF